MNFIQAIVLGIVEGITEFLPISSTGHLILTGRVLGLTQTEFLKTFEIAIQLGAIMSVVVLYWRKLLLAPEIFKRVIAAFLPTALLGLVLYKFIKQFLLSNEAVVLWSLGLGGLLLIIFEFWHKEHPEAQVELSEISYKQSLVIGLFQSVAMIPGVSRAAATILGGLLVGLKRKTIVEFSFLLAIPTMAAATGLDLYQSAGSFNSQQFGILAIGFVVSFIVAIVAIKFLLRFIQTHDFSGFGIYRIVLALVFWWFIW
jgi:undecaprenyl-diphosphatase